MNRFSATTGLLDGTVAFSPTGKFFHLHERGRSGEVNANKLHDPEAPSSLSSETSSEDKIPEEVITIWTNAAKVDTCTVCEVTFDYCAPQTTRQQSHCAPRTTH
jgi:hypothetical protein